MAAARTGTTSDPFVSRVWLRRAFWKNFGQNLDEAWRTWPEQEFHDTVSVLNAEAQASRSASGSSGKIAPETTQANFDGLPRRPRDAPNESES